MKNSIHNIDINLQPFVNEENTEATRKMIAKYANLHFVDFYGKFKKKQFIESLQEYFLDVTLNETNIVYHIWHFIQLYNRNEIHHNEDTLLNVEFCIAVLHDNVDKNMPKTELLT